MVSGLMQFGLVAVKTLDVVASCHAIGVQVFGGFQQIAEFDFFVAADAGNGGRTSQIGVGEFLDHGFFKTVFIVQNVMREPYFFGNAAGIVDILPRTARTFFGQSGPVVVKLKGHANHVIALTRQHCCHN